MQSEFETDLLNAFISVDSVIFHELLHALGIASGFEMFPSGSPPLLTTNPILNNTLFDSFSGIHVFDTFLTDSQTGESFATAWSPAASFRTSASDWQSAFRASPASVPLSRLYLAATTPGRVAFTIPNSSEKITIHTGSGTFAEGRTLSHIDKTAHGSSEQLMYPDAPTGPLPDSMFIGSGDTRVLALPRTAGMMLKTIGWTLCGDAPGECVLGAAKPLPGIMTTGSSSSTASSAPPSGSSSGLPLWSIIVMAVGSGVAFALIVTFSWVLVSRKKDRKKGSYQHVEGGGPDDNPFTTTANKSTAKKALTPTGISSGYDETLPILGKAGSTQSFASSVNVPVGTDVSSLFLSQGASFATAPETRLTTPASSSVTLSPGQQPRSATPMAADPRLVALAMNRTWSSTDKLPLMSRDDFSMVANSTTASSIRSGLPMDLPMNAASASFSKRASETVGSVASNKSRNSAKGKSKSKVNKGWEDPDYDSDPDSLDIPLYPVPSPSGIAKPDRARQLPGASMSFSEAASATIGAYPLPNLKLPEKVRAKVALAQAANASLPSSSRSFASQASRSLTASSSVAGIEVPTKQWLDPNSPFQWKQRVDRSA